MKRLCQVIAVEKGAKKKRDDEKTKIYHTIQKAALLSGLSRRYTPKDDEGEKLPSESTKVQVTAHKAMEDFAKVMTELFDVTATKEWGNCAAVADVEVDGHVVAQKVPVTYLLFLEKQLDDLYTFVKKMPTLDLSQDWHFDSAIDCYASEPIETTRTKKVPRNHVKAEATDNHPAQVEVYTEDVIVGTWKKVEFSGALPAQTKNEILERIEKLQRAVKFAREEANSMQVQDISVGEKFFKFVFKPLESK